ncbi:MAG TPA: hypothetical protein PKC39_14595 [Ferruginibacter sp.]|nr:hypothetical protein [Ferruginibacter sp.]HMP22185.1 hypothetical protein [Ferruginibacter sp.]
MVNLLLHFFKNLPLNYQKWRYQHSLKKAIKHANHIKHTTGYKCVVLFVDNVRGYKAFKKDTLKLLVKSKYFKKGTTVQKLESMAVYTTN